MTQEEKAKINKTIADYMGLEWKEFPEGVGVSIEEVMGPQTRYSMDLFTDSLDALVPVWEKLRVFPAFHKYKMIYQATMGLRVGEGESLSEASSQVTYKYIKERDER